MEKPKKRRYIGVRMCVLFVVFFLLAAGPDLHAESLPEWMLPLREAVYEQKLKANEVEPLYRAARASAQIHCSGTALDLAVSRCEYLMGRVLQYYEQNREARVHYEEGMRLAEKALNAAPSAEAWLLRSENLSQLCSLGPWTYTVTHGLDVEKFAKNALSINSRNAAAQYIVAARWVYAPSPWNDLKKGIEMMKAIPENSDMGKDDSFNVYASIGYAYVQQKKYADARPWLLKSREIYPTNKFISELLDKK
jgi:tetratricopeptide (TPR) repeat protein